MTFKILFCLVAFSASAQNIKESVGFRENKGQIMDQNRKPNSLVKFLLNTKGLNVQIRENGFSYEVYEPKLHPKEKGIDQNLAKLTFPLKEPENRSKEILDYDCHRIDIDFVNSNSKAALICDGKSEEYDNYYNLPNKSEGILGVHQYRQITYRNIYPKIDVVFSIPNDRQKPVEYNFVIHPGGKISDIQMKFNGAKTELVHNKIEINTRFGLMKEILPASWIEEGKNKKGISIEYRQIKNGVYGFNTKNAISDKTVVIDPVPERLWESVYGLEDRLQEFTAMASDNNGGIYFSGNTTGASSFYASSGAYQTTLAGSSGEDGVIAKFDSDGKRIWGTYFGGLGLDNIYSLATDLQGNIMITGMTQSDTNISTPGAYKEHILDATMPQMDAFLVKFNSNGIRLWGTYLGGSAGDHGYLIATDKNNNIYVAGETLSGDKIAVNSNFQTQFNHGWLDGFLSKFDSNGKIVWSTYVGGEGYDYLRGGIKCADDYLVVTGRSESKYLATPGVFQENYYPKVGTETGDLIVYKFTLDGSRLWSTYYGGERAVWLTSGSVEIDNQNNIYIAGKTNCTNNIASTGSFNDLYPGDNFGAGFLAKLDSNGKRVWGSYLGRYLEVNSIIFKNEHLYVSGSGSWDTTITTPCAFRRQGFDEGYLGKYTTNGELVFGTYTGKPSGYENGEATLDGICIDNNNDIIIGGGAQKNHEDFHNTTYYFMKFHESDKKVFPNPESNSPVCLGTEIKLRASGGTSYLWTGPKGFTSTEQNPIIANATAENEGVYSCTITADEGCLDTLTTTVFVGDKIPPVPDVADLPTLNVNCSSQITTFPTATDACSGVITATTESPLFYSIPGTYILVWKYDDGNGNSMTQNQNLVIGAPQPIPTAGSPQTFCIQQNAKLSDIAVIGQNIKWYDQALNGALLNTVTKLQDGVTYFATQTINGCESERLPIQIEMPNSAPTGDENQSFCSTEDATIEDIVVSGSNIIWYATATQTASLPPGTKLKDNTFYYATQTVRNCESIPRLAIKTTFVNTLNANDYSETVCGDWNDSFHSVDLSSYTSKFIDNATNYSFTYYGSLDGAINQTESDKITKITDYRLTVGSHDIYIRILSEKGCQQIVKLNLNLVYNPIIPISDIVPICDNGSILIDAGSGNDIYKWSTSESSQQINVSASGNYSVDATKNYGSLSCTSHKNFIVVKSSSAIITKIEIEDWTDDKNTLTVFLDSGSIGDYEYSLDGIHFQDSNTFQDLPPGRYNVQIKDKNGCQLTQKEVNVLMYPKFFTPNGDGYNDSWGIKASNMDNKSTIRIFDRYGKLIKEMTIDKTWDGTLGGNPLPATDYWFSIQLEDGRLFKGHFALKR